jgi:hypothetical protein
MVREVFGVFGDPDLEGADVSADLSQPVSTDIAAMAKRKEWMIDFGVD